MHATTLTSMADGVANELNLPQRLVRIRERDDVNGDYAAMQVHVEGGAYDALSNRQIEQVEGMGWDFICFRVYGDDTYALFEGGPFNDRRP